MLRAIKYRAYPNKEQERILSNKLSRYDAYSERNIRRQRV